MEDKPFAGVRVVELAQWVFVPVSGALLAAWGADVIHVEPTRGDPYRGLATQGIGSERQGVNLSMALANAGKRSLALDVQSKQGREVLHRLLESADVLLTNLRPGALGRLGLDADTSVHESVPQPDRVRADTATASAAPMPTGPATTPRPSGHAGAWPTCSPRRSASTRSASAARWGTGTRRCRWRSVWRPPC